MIYLIGIGNSLLPLEEYKQASVYDVIEYFRDKDFIAVDTETQGRDCHSKKILSLQLGDFDNQFVIDCRVVDILNFKELLESKTCILHNAKFDYKFLKKAGIVLNKIYDTMLAECVIYCGYESFGYGLQALVKRYLGIHLDKDVRGDFFKLTSQPFTGKQIEYAAKDVKYLHEIKEKQEKKLKYYGLENCLNLENEVVKALGDIEYNGMILDSKEWIKLANHNMQQLHDVEIALDDILIQDPKLGSSIFSNISPQETLFGERCRSTHINYSSSSQVIKIANRLGFNIESTEERFITRLANKHPFFLKLGEYRELSKRVTTYGKSFLRAINRTTGRVHTDFWQIVSSGRVSSGNKELGAPNLQNIPAQTNDEIDNRWRNCFKARKGFTWVSADYSMQEMMLLAEYSDENAFIDALNNDEDLHCKVGSIMFGRTIDKVKDKAIRTKVKTINFGKAYGMGPSKLADQLKIPLIEAIELFNIYAHTFPKLDRFLKASGNEVVKTLRSQTPEPVKRIRWFPKLRVFDNSPESQGEIAKAMRDGTNMIIQGSAANICKEALVEVRNLINRYNTLYNKEVAFLICTVHDAIDVEVADDYADNFASSMEKVMIEVANKYVSKVSMKVDITKTKMWNK